MSGLNENEERCIPGQNEQQKSAYKQTSQRTAARHGGRRFQPTGYGRQIHKSLRPPLFDRPLDALGPIYKLTYITSLKSRDRRPPFSPRRGRLAPRVLAFWRRPRSRPPPRPSAFHCRTSCHLVAQHITLVMLLRCVDPHTHIGVRVRVG